MRNAAGQALPTPTTATTSRHVGRRARFIDKHQLQRIEIELAFKPLPTPLTDVELTVGEW